MAVFREYTSDESFTEVNIPAEGVSEFQVALTFARDRDEKHLNNGKFIPCWDTARVTPQVINDFKKLFPSAKVLVSIGNDKGHFPLEINKVEAWIEAATESLTDIIREYNLDGLDVYYENIETYEDYYLPLINPDIFVNSVGQVIQNLKDKKVITLASISPNNYTFQEFYLPLYLKYGNFIDHVVFQCFNTSQNEKPIDPNVLLEKFKKIAPKKLLLGYTGIKEDWASVLFPPPFFFVIIFILLFCGIINGASIKVTRCSITCFPPQWILDLLSSPRITILPRLL